MAATASYRSATAAGRPSGRGSALLPAAGTREFGRGAFERRLGRPIRPCGVRPTSGRTATLAATLAAGARSELGSQHRLDVRRNFAPLLTGSRSTARSVIARWTLAAAAVATAAIVPATLVATTLVATAAAGWHPAADVRISIDPATTASAVPFPVDCRRIAGPDPAATTGAARTLPVLPAPFGDEVLGDGRLVVELFVRRQRTEVRLRPRRFPGNADLGVR